MSHLWNQRWTHPEKKSLKINHVVILGKTPGWYWFPQTDCSWGKIILNFCFVHNVEERLNLWASFSPLAIRECAKRGGTISWNPPSNSHKNIGLVLKEKLFRLVGVEYHVRHFYHLFALYHARFVRHCHLNTHATLLVGVNNSMWFYKIEKFYFSDLKSRL